MIDPKSSRRILGSIVLSAFTFTCVSMSVKADTGANTVSSNLSQLEDSFFEHEYPKDDSESRLSRLEKFVFGEVKSGSDESRITQLLLAVPPERLKAGKDKVNQTESSPEVRTSSNPQRDAEIPSEAEEGAGKADDDSDLSRLSKLEQQVLGRTYPNESTSRRADRLEKAVFGSPSTSSNLGDRLTILEPYAKRHNTPGQYSSSSSPPPYSSGPAREKIREAEPSPDESVQEVSPVNAEVGNLLQRVNTMEREVFGRTFPKKPLPERLQQLEKEIGVDSHDLSQKDLPSQAAALWSEMAPTSVGQQPRQSARSYNRNATSSSINFGDSYASDENPETGDGSTFSSNDTQTQNNSGHQSWLHKLGKMIQGAGGLAAGALMSPSFAPGYGGYGYPYGGYGSPYGGYGSPYGMYGNSYMNPGFAPNYGGGGYYPNLRQFGSPIGGSPFGGSPFGGFGGMGGFGGW
jgi:hypothetical protein